MPVTFYKDHVDPIKLGTASELGLVNPDGSPKAFSFEFWIDSNFSLQAWENLLVLSYKDHELIFWDGHPCLHFNDSVLDNFNTISPVHGNRNHIVIIQSQQGNSWEVGYFIEGKEIVIREGKPINIEPSTELFGGGIQRKDSSLRSSIGPIRIWDFAVKTEEEANNLKNTKFQDPYRGKTPKKAILLDEDEKLIKSIEDIAIQPVLEYPEKWAQKFEEKMEKGKSQKQQLLTWAKSKLEQHEKTTPPSHQKQLPTLQETKPKDTKPPPPPLTENDLQKLLSSTQQLLSTARDLNTSRTPTEVELDYQVIPLAGGGLIFPTREQTMAIAGGLSSLRMEFEPVEQGIDKPIPKVPVPDVSGMTEIMARRLLKNAQLDTLIKHQLTDQPTEVARVIQQLPAAGSDAFRDSQVTIFIGKTITKTES